MNAKALLGIRRKRRILDYGKQIHNVSKACRHFGVFRETFYKWKRDYERESEKALVLCLTGKEQKQKCSIKICLSRIYNFKRNVSLGLHTTSKAFVKEWKSVFLKLHVYAKVK